MFWHTDKARTMPLTVEFEILSCFSTRERPRLIPGCSISRPSHTWCGFGTCRPQTQVGSDCALCSFTTFSASSDNSVSVLTLMPQNTLSEKNANYDVTRPVSECRAKSPCDEATYEAPASSIATVGLKVCALSLCRRSDGWNGANEVSLGQRCRGFRPVMQLLTVVALNIAAGLVVSRMAVVGLICRSRPFPWSCQTRSLESATISSMSKLTA